MKKTFYITAACATLLMAGACSGNNKSAGIDKSAKAGDRTEVYTGVIPAADASGIRYTLKLDFDDDHNYTKGDYDLLETYFAGDSISPTGLKDLKSFTSEGDFTVEKGQGANSGKTYLKLVQDAKDSSAGSNAGPLYFLVESDSTIVMVNSDLQPSETPGLNYTLKIAK